MKNAAKASILVALCISITGMAAGAQNLLNQSKDDLLKDFDVGKSLTAPPINGPVTTPPPTWSPGSQSAGQQAGTQPAGGPEQTSPLLGNYGQGASPGSYQFPGQQKPLLKRIIEGAMNAVNVSSNDTDGTHVKVPFVDVNVGGQSQGVKVKAPFVNYNTQDGAQVKAPFVNLQGKGGVKVKAPFVNINHGNPGNSHAAAPAAQHANPAPAAVPNILPNQGSSLR